jgi:hypothetical protein
LNAEIDRRGVSAREIEQNPPGREAR